MSQEKKGFNLRIGSSPTKVNIIFIIIIITIVGSSIVGYIVFQAISEENVRYSVFEQYRQRQILYASSLAENMQSDLNMLMSRLQTIALSKQVQDREFSSQQITLLLQQVYTDSNRISKIDGVYVADNKDVIVNYFNPSVEGSAPIGRDVSNLPPAIEYRNNLPNPTFSNAYTSPIDGTLRIALIHPIYNSDTAEYMGSTGMVLILDSFFSHYGNIQDINLQYLAALDNKGTVLISAARDIVGRDVYSDYVEDKHPDKSAYDHYEKVMSGSPSVMTFGFGTGGERLNIGEPIILNGKPIYSLFVVTPTAAIYNEIDRVLAAHRAVGFLLLGIISAAISLSIFFLLRWNNMLTKAVKTRTQQLEAANKRLEEHDKMQKEFIDIAAHELRTPVQPMLGITELIHESMDGKDKVEITKDDVEMLSRNAKRLERLSADILEVSRIESDTLKLNRELVDLEDKIQDAIKDVKSFIPSGHSIQILYDSSSLTSAERVIVQGDKARIFEVLSNIVGNAIKFTEDGSIRIELKKGERDAIVKITDNGQGIDPEIFPRLFTKFATKSHQGTGLGLYISKAIIEAHGGKIWAENNKDGKGAAFTFTLPLADLKGVNEFAFKEDRKPVIEEG